MTDDTAGAMIGTGIHSTSEKYATQIIPSYNSTDDAASSVRYRI